MQSSADGKTALHPNGAAPTAEEVRNQLEESYNAILDRDLSQLAGNFVELVRLAKLEPGNDGHAVERESLEVDLRSSNIVRSAENLLSMIAEWKQSILVHDFASMQQVYQERTEELLQQNHANREAIQELQKTIQQGLAEMER